VQKKKKEEADILTKILKEEEYSEVRSNDSETKGKERSD
jgi:hypothetical protein